VRRASSPPSEHTMPWDYPQPRLPHRQPEDAALFVTWRLYGSLPDVPGLFLGVNAGKVFVAPDREPGRAAIGPERLAGPRVAGCAADVPVPAGRRLRLYGLHAWAVLGNHVPMCIRLNATVPRIMSIIQGYSARQANRILARGGQPFWRQQYLDRWIRNSREIGRVAAPIESNPVSSGLVQKPEDWRWSSAWACREARPTESIHA
jgi:hypothetical protein